MEDEVFVVHRFELISMSIMRIVSSDSFDKMTQRYPDITLLLIRQTSLSLLCLMRTSLSRMLTFKYQNLKNHKIRSQLLCVSA